MTTSPDIDRNLVPWRPDLASESLRGVHAAERYAAGTLHQAVRGIVPMRSAPDASRGQATEMLHGETITVYEVKDGWAWGQLTADGYVGYVEAAALSDRVAAPTHRIRAFRAFLYPDPDFKRPPVRALSFRSPVEVVETAKGYARIREAGEPGGWVPEVALGPLDAAEPDVVATAQRFLGVPYLWGGRSSLGIDCSGLVQLACAAAGHAIERDTYRQARTAGTLVGTGEGAGLRRGDLVYFPGHVGLMADGETLIHANVRAACVSLDPVREVAARVEADEGRGITAVRRFG
ncbi:NlpC/P60 family protein [Inquilinus sp. Marseille-Q2685]|uniref:C40 family peptidase n=1 Tax=Inquilinus sp. Marseille-Q2685 TaxID=2866581 RepID=UPI00272D6D50|nr:NlpC/P60 family protein [Inquilinus sp. Marseille-Q2685]